MKELFSELKAIADVKVDMAKTEIILWQKLAKVLDKHSRAEFEGNKEPTSTLDIAQQPSQSIYLGVSQAAKYLGISRSTIWRFRQEGRLKCIKFGKSARYKIADLEALAESMTSL